jgi:predicted Rossmann fold nucleotide-binding protein DprA/Smf involved in DNA uptake
MLIKQGALLVENSEEIMSYLGMQKPVWGVKLGARQDLDELEKQIMEKLEQEAFYDEELVKVLQIPLLPLLEKLSLLELKGMVNKDKQDKWQIKNY